MSEILDLTIERPVAGGRMLARHDGRIVFVAGAIPGERVRARVERSSKHAIWAAAVEILEASPDRREAAHDPACGGSTFAHIAYDRQRELKQQILVDAFRRLGRITLETPPIVAPSPEQAYRLRARLHAGQGRLGYYLEGTHTVCDAAITRQMRPDSSQSAAAVFSALGPRAADCASVVVSENVDATECVVHLEPRERARLDDVAAEVTRIPAGDLPGVTGITTIVRHRIHTITGREAITDTAAALFGGGSPIDNEVAWTRRAPSFFQGNRYLIGALLRRVLELATADDLVDLYAGVGLFAVALAARGARVVAVEAEPFAAEDLAGNARPWKGRLGVTLATVEDAVRRPPVRRPGMVVLDPPRIGVSSEALAGLIGWRVPQLIYVSCDPPTLARDAAKLVAAGYALTSMDGFDLFPNTPHLEAVAVFARTAP